jgi:hypothetical protein
MHLKIYLLELSAPVLLELAFAFDPEDGGSQVPESALCGVLKTDMECFCLLLYSIK